MHGTRSLLLLAPAALVFTACSPTAPHPSQRISLSATIGSAAHSAASGIAADVIVGGSGGKVRITSAQMVLSHLKLAGDAACSSSSDGETAEASGASESPDASEPDANNNDEHDCESMDIAPVLISLPLDGSTKVILDAVVPAGTYTGLRAKLEAVEGDDDGASAFLTAHPDFQGVSVKVGGVFTDAAGVDHPFTFTSGVEAEIAVDFPAPVTVGASTSNLTIDVNVGSWFTGAAGAAIDPTNAANQSAIEQAIRASLSAFEDDNHDGMDDHQESGH